MVKKAGLSDEIILTLRNSRKAYLSIYAMVLAIIVLLIAAFIQNLPVNNVALFASLLFVFMGIKGTELHRFLTRIDITPISIIITKGYINTSSIKMDIYALSDIRVTQNAFQRMFNYGNVDVYKFQDVPFISIRNVNNPKEVALVIQKALNDLRHS